MWPRCVMSAICYNISFSASGDIVSKCLKHILVISGLEPNILFDASSSCINLWCFDQLSSELSSASHGLPQQTELFSSWKTVKHSHDVSLCIHTLTHRQGHSLLEPSRVKLLVVASCCYTLVNPTYCLQLSAAEALSFIHALWSCFPQIIYWGPLGLCRDSRQTGCTCLIKESDVNKCKHSIFYTHYLFAALLCLVSAGLGAFLFLVKPSVKFASTGVDMHFIFHIHACAMETNLTSSEVWRCIMNNRIHLALFLKMILCELFSQRLLNP